MKIASKTEGRTSRNDSANVLLNKNDTVRIRTWGYTAFALVAFTANSVLCRLALGANSIDAASFSAIRLVSGALVLLLVAAGRKNGTDEHKGTWISAFMLFLYAVAFSFAYVSLSAGTGALILFGSVQATMIITALWMGERPRMTEYLGLFVALAGLIYLVFPGLDAPSPLGAVLMSAAGASWGVYSLRGRGSTNPVTVTSDNFLKSTPFVLLVSLIFIKNIQINLTGAFLAFLSGALTSGIGYVAWYAALRELSATRAALVQLIVPVLAALGGVILLSEQLSVRLVLSTVLILGGVAKALSGRGQVVLRK
jgi:drug/metabolite transporter (DMT)-like permease